MKKVMLISFAFFFVILNSMSIIAVNAKENKGAVSMIRNEDDTKSSEYIYGEEVMITVDSDEYLEYTYEDGNPTTPQENKVCDGAITQFCELKPGKYIITSTINGIQTPLGVDMLNVPFYVFDEYNPQTQSFGINDQDVNLQSGELPGDGIGQMQLIDEVILVMPYINFELLSDIDAKTTNSWPNGFKPIGTELYYAGNFEGNNFAINDLFIYNISENSTGLFGNTNGGKFSNITLNNPIIISNFGANTGSFIGYSYFTILENCYAINGQVISNTENTGGLVGVGEKMEILNSGVDMLVEGNNFVGGLVGSVKIDFYASNVFASGSVKGTNSVGGLIGRGFDQNNFLKYAFLIQNAYTNNQIEQVNPNDSLHAGVASFIGKINSEAGTVRVTNSFTTSTIIADASENISNNYISAIYNTEFNSSDNSTVGVIAINNMIVNGTNSIQQNLFANAPINNYNLSGVANFSNINDDVNINNSAQIKYSIDELKNVNLWNSSVNQNNMFDVSRVDDSNTGENNGISYYPQLNNQPYQIDVEIIEFN